jgi:SAM-dependent methyltransferase
MTNTTTNLSSILKTSFLEQYSLKETVLKYTRQTAGYGINYLLSHDYGKIYLECIRTYIPDSKLKKGIRLWEFGCGAGMNLLHLVSVLEREGIPVEFACGTDFSEALVAAAKKEAESYAAPDQTKKVRFLVAANENLVGEGATGLGVNKDQLLGSFDLVFGVNTIRFCHRLNNVDQCVRDISALLRDGGVCINIDMNRNFPAFRSRLRDARARPEEVFLPTLDEYARPFSAAGFEILKKQNFCWIPHSAGRGLTTVMKTMTPILNILALSRAMRSLVIARKVRRVL